MAHVHVKGEPVRPSSSLQSSSEALGGQHCKHAHVHPPTPLLLSLLDPEQSSDIAGSKGSSSIPWLSQRRFIHLPCSASTAQET